MMTGWPPEKEATFQSNQNSLHILRPSSSFVSSPFPGRRPRSSSSSSSSGGGRHGARLDGGASTPPEQKRAGGKGCSHLDGWRLATTSVWKARCAYLAHPRPECVPGCLSSASTSGASFPCHRESPALWTGQLLKSLIAVFERSETSSRCLRPVQRCPMLLPALVLPIVFLRRSQNVTPILMLSQWV